MPKCVSLAGVCLIKDLRFAQSAMGTKGPQMNVLWNCWGKTRNIICSLAAVSSTDWNLPVRKSRRNGHWYGFHRVCWVTQIKPCTRIGTYRGFRKGGSGFVTGKGPLPLGGFEGYKPLVRAMVNFFESGQPPVSRQETLEIIAFIMAADESKKQGGREVAMPQIE